MIIFLELRRIQETNVCHSPYKTFLPAYTDFHSRQMTLFCRQYIVPRSTGRFPHRFLRKQLHLKKENRMHGKGFCAHQHFYHDLQNSYNFM